MLIVESNRIKGFGPFQNVAVNESWLTVSKLWDMDWPNELRLVTRELPVVYEIAKSEIKKLWTEEKPDVIIFSKYYLITKF